MWDSLSGHLCFYLFFNSASGLLLFLSPMGGSLLSHLTSKPLLCLLMFSFKNKKMAWLHQLIKFLPTSSEVVWFIFFWTAMIILIHFHLLLVNILLCMTVPALSCWLRLHQSQTGLKKSKGCLQRSSSMLIYSLIQTPVVSVRQESSNGRKGTISYGSNDRGRADSEVLPAFTWSQLLVSVVPEL